MTVWRKIKNWTYEYYPVTESAHRFGRVGRLIKTWRAKQNPGNPA